MADSVYGVGTVEKVLRREGVGYVLGVRSDYRFIAQIAHPVDTAVQEDGPNADPAGWIRLSAGEGTKGARLHDWSYHQLGDVDAKDFDAGWSGQWTRGLLLRRNINDGDIRYFATFSPKGTTINTLVAVEGRRWAIEDSFETTKNELGLDHNETRSWHGWYRHVSLVMLAFAMVTTIRHKANHVAEKKASEIAQSSHEKPLIRWSVQEIRHIAGRLGQRNIKPAHFIAWSLWRRAHQATAQHAHLRNKRQL